MSPGPEVLVGPCPSPTCQSPVFEDERFCEVCGTALATEPATEPVDTHLPPELVQRVRVEEGDVAAVSDRGWHRPRNEDSVAVAAHGDRVAVAVCDGVGSTANAHRAAQVAAQAAVKALRYALTAPSWPTWRELHGLVNEAFEQAQTAVIALTDDEPDTGGPKPASTTMVVALVGPGRAVVGNVGDSRAYWLGQAADDRRLLTVDDTTAQELMAEGVPPDDALAHPQAHFITRWIGADAGWTEPRITDLEVGGPGLLLACTDGLWNYFEDPGQLAELVDGATDTTVPGIAERLTDAALEAGGRDNITVALIPLRPTTTQDPPSGPAKE